MTNIGHMDSILHRSTTVSYVEECSSHESSIFQIKLKRNKGCVKEDKENERHTNDFRKALNEGQIEADLEKRQREGKEDRVQKSESESKGAWTCVS